MARCRCGQPENMLAVSVGPQSTVMPSFRQPSSARFMRGVMPPACSVQVMHQW